MKPAEYRHSCTVSKQIPYHVVDTSTKGTQPGVGVLAAGRVVWLNQELTSASGTASVQAFVDGVGVISVDPSSLSAVC